MCGVAQTEIVNACREIGQVGVRLSIGKASEQAYRFVRRGHGLGRLPQMIEIGTYVVEAERKLLKVAVRISFCQPPQQGEGFFGGGQRFAKSTRFGQVDTQRIESRGEPGDRLEIILIRCQSSQSEYVFSFLD
jgi:hypothetical protein